MYRLAIISVQSGACIANPIYKTEKECFDEANRLYNPPLGDSTIQLGQSEDGRKYIIPIKPTDFVVIVEPVEPDIEEVF